MELTKMSIEVFLDKLASKEPAPGGGSASALMAALGASLLQMVANLTIGRKKYAQHEDLMKEILTESELIRQKLILAIDRDTAAYNGVAAVFAMPKESEEEKAGRGAAMEAALKAATEVPFEMMELGAAAFNLLEKSMGKTNTNAASDVAVAAFALSAGIEGAWRNVLINLDGIKDGAYVADKKAAGEALMNEYNRVYDEILSRV